MLQRAVDDTHEAGQVWHSDRRVSESQVGAYKNLAKLGYDVKAKPYDHVQGEYRSVGDHVPRGASAQNEWLDIERRPALGGRLTQLS